MQFYQKTKNKPNINSEASTVSWKKMNSKNLIERVHTTLCQRYTLFSPTHTSWPLLNSRVCCISVMLSISHKLEFGITSMPIFNVNWNLPFQCQFFLMDEMIIFYSVWKACVPIVRSCTTSILMNPTSLLETGIFISLQNWSSPKTRGKKQTNIPIFTHSCNSVHLNLIMKQKSL